MNVSQSEIEALNHVLSEVEDKNRRLNDKLNEIIFNRASQYKQKTIESLQRGRDP